jgi:hypothetical protein
MIDLLQQSNKAGGGSYPKFFLIIININTKFMWAFPVKSKSEDDVVPTLMQWFENTKGVHQITSDDESALSTERVRKWAEKNDVYIRNLKATKHHKTLSVVDRAIRTLRDMNINDDSKSDRAKRDFTRDEMKSLVDAYNNSPHSSLDGQTPAEVQKDPHAEKMFIIKKVGEEYDKGDQDEKDDGFGDRPPIDRRKGLSTVSHGVKPPEALKVGDWVRFLIKRDVLGKHRYAVSRKKVKITGKEKSKYVCEASNGETDIFGRDELWKAKGTEKWLRSFKDQYV